MRLNVYPIIFALLLSVPTGAVTYTPSIENTQWQLQPSIYGCIFRQPIPVYGFASFFQEAGEDLIFYLEPSYDRMKKGDADLVIEAPDWLPNITTTNLGKIAVEDNSLPIRIDSTRSDRMLSELGKGMAPTVTGSAIFEDEDIRVRVSPAKFNQYYVDFVACIAGLLPVNFSQVERVSIQFDVGQQELDKEHQARLSLIATYVLADPLVTTVYIDAHTDNQGTRYLNRRVAEKRMLKTLDWLVSLGVDPNMVIARYHGDRYPVESNETIAGRAANRRVTLRLERLINQPDDPLNRHPQFARNYR